ncbi:Protein of unknown function [Anaerovirgula multivorans]|uniref:DUF2958 domain-containing protein n=1 Tax=Anaerovirgula multivorans TaxID=312168 RepID=A0A239CUK7_9FIRM|nr:DUF2958 domain-containing protein [Anaerovirgula multivorans]SNS23542.1 Protein of unknown function [Anaerovirgula multivorans]
MKLLTEEIRKLILPLYSTEEVEEKVAVVKFFDPYSSWTWYVIEGEEQENGDYLFFGLVHGFEREYGYFALNELESIDFMGAPRIERDLYFSPTPVSKL